MVIWCHLHYSMDNTEADLNGNIFLVLHEFCTFLYIVLLPVSFSWWHPILFLINFILVTELSFSVFCISSSSLTPSVSSFFVADWITSYVTANIARHMFCKETSLAPYLSIKLIAKCLHHHVTVPVVTVVLVDSHIHLSYL